GEDVERVLIEAHAVVVEADRFPDLTLVATDQTVTVGHPHHLLHAGKLLQGLLRDRRGIADHVDLDDRASLATLGVHARRHTRIGAERPQDLLGLGALLRHLGLEQDDHMILFRGYSTMPEAPACTSCGLRSLTTA